MSLSTAWKVWMMVSWGPCTGAVIQGTKSRSADTYTVSPSYSQAPRVWHVRLLSLCLLILQISKWPSLFLASANGRSLPTPNPLFHSPTHLPSHPSHTCNVRNFHWLRQAGHKRKSKRWLKEWLINPKSQMCLKGTQTPESYTSFNGFFFMSSSSLGCSVQIPSS